MRIRGTTLSVLGLALLVGVVIAQVPDRRAFLGVTFRRLDSNSDGKLSQAEFARFAAVSPRLKDNPQATDAIFNRLDADGDGALSLAEFSNLAQLADREPAKPGKNPPGVGNPGTNNPGTNPFADPKIPTPGTSAKPNVVDAETAPTAEQLQFFEKKIRPVLVGKCQGCHSAADEKFKGGLALDSRQGIRLGGDSGPAVILGQPSQSPLIRALKGDGFKQMPPKEPLPAEVIADFETWVRMGAPDPRTDGAARAKKTESIDIEAGKKHWAFQAVKLPSIPAVRDAAWPQSDLDRFVLAKLEEKKLIPSAAADRHTLIRRVSFDLIGLPPTPEQVEAFVNDRSADAFEKVVNELLASPHFGERWGRHWLDVARYAESSGKEQNMLYPMAWRYRDYVIEAFNTDKPYDQFLKEQLAGDLLPARDDTDRAKKLIATGYLAIGPKSHNTPSRLQFTLDLVDEQIDAFSQGMLGLTVACARCHDHKFDPIPMRDYYAIAGIFTSTETKFGTPQLLIARNSAALAELPSRAEVPTTAPLSARELAAMRQQLDQLKEQRKRVLEQARRDGQPPVQFVIINAQIGTLEKQLSNYHEDGTPKKLAMAVADRTIPRDSPIYQRGEPDKPGEIVPRGFLQVLPPGPAIQSGSGRKELAEWVASKDNPLTARVMVNRVWLHLFGRGLVPTPDNFGTTGQPPSHPELLDYLAVSFMNHGWSIKSLIRQIVLSRTYQMSSHYHEANAATDPDNIYLWRMSPRRLDAEALRDAMLAVSGELDPKPTLGSPVSRSEGPVQAFLLRSFGGLDKLAETRHRSVYLPILRDNLPEVLDIFDFAEPSLVTGIRDDTSVPGQGLYLLNNPQVMKLAEKTAERLLRDYLSTSERIDAGFRLAFGRPATPPEAAAAESFMQRFRSSEKHKYRRSQDLDRAAWSAFAQALFAAAEFRYLD